MNKILIVDDNVINIRLLDTLLKAKGFKIAIATNGRDAIDISKEILPDLILLDIMMPDIDGFETCRRIKKIENLTEIPVIFLSALGDSKSKVEGFEAGGVDFITKPLDADELYARVNTHLTLRSLVNELKDKNEELQKTQQTLIQSEKMASLGYLVTGMAHELNTPLGVMKTSNSIVLEELKGEKPNRKSVMECLQLIDKNINRMNDLVSDFKNLSISQLSQNREDFPIVKTVEDTIVMTINIFERNDIDIEVTGNEEIVHSNYPDAIEKIIKDLVENSIKHGFVNRDKNKIKVDVNHDGNTMVIDYIDNGIGIPKDVAEKIFDPFFTTKKSKGTGLGLSVAYNIITQKLGGGISLVNEDIGSHFRLVFPVD